MSHRDAFFSRPLAETDPEIFGAIEKELGRQRHEIELIGLGKHRVARRSRSAGFDHDQQVRRGLSG